MRTILQGVLCACLLAAPAAAELPQVFGGWSGESVQLISLPQLAEAAGGHAAAFREFGFLGAERREYSRSSSKLTATVWRMGDVTGSYGLFTFLLEPGMTLRSMGADPSATGPEAFLLQRGPYVLEVRGAAISSAEAELLAGSIQEVAGSESMFPPLPGYLPEEGLVQHSQKYAIGPVAFAQANDRVPASAVRFDMGAEAMAAQYLMDGKAMQLLLVIYPTPQLAGKMLRDFQALPALTSSTPGKTIFVERKGSLIAFVMDAPSLEATERLLSLVRYEMGITWNEYVPPPGENAGSLMIAVFSLAGFILLVALFSGLAFGGIRLIVKRFVPVPIFDRPEQVEFIRLKLTDS